jgi:ATP-dependent exoDNAse (exonuclease V) beta subunit
MTDDRELTDRDVRARILRDLDTTLFVEAGAGSGKTTALVDRVIALVTTGAAELAHIAAITFTEKAGAELRDRIRRTLETHAAEITDAEVRARGDLALDQLDGAAIGTLHSFAQRILSENPIEAGLPPRVEVLDEVSSGVEFDRRWGAFREGLLADPELERTLQLLLASGVKPNALEALAAAFDANWDLVGDRVPPTAPEPPGVRDLLEEAFTAIDAVCAARADCRDGEDKLYVRLDQIAEWVVGVRTIDDELDLLDALTDGVPSFAAGLGKKPNWTIDLDELRTRVRAAGDGLDEVKAKVGEACARRLGVAIRGFTLDAAHERRGTGQLEFHDLLVLARSLLCDDTHGATVRSRLHERYQRILLDEFQDTDPIQIEIAVRIAAVSPGRAAAGTASWEEVAVEPGRLFVVGDPKQSIYSFRRADISTFLAARDRLVGESDIVRLTSNFRSAGAVIAWVNVVFAALFSEVSDVEPPVPSQPDYIGLDATRDSPPVGPPVAVLGRKEHPKGTLADGLRAAEADEVAATIVRILDEGWSVSDQSNGWRPARLGDITILVPARTSLPFLQDALDAAKIPYRAEATSLVYATRAVRDLLMVLRAVDDPTNTLHIVSALRTPLLGCGDDDLFRFKVDRRGRWSYLAEQPDTVPIDDPVRLGLEYLRTLHDDRHWRAPSELLDRIARDCRAFELGFADGRPRDAWRRLRYVIDQARAWSEATGGGLRSYVYWVGLQSAEGARVAEAILPETDDDAVRIMTIHAAKGLEFPITIVSGMSTVPSRRPAPAEVVFPPGGTVGYRFGRHVCTEEWTNWAPIDEQMGFHERIRLLYVACTRACDHLVVSLHRKERGEPPKSGARTNAELLLDGMGPLLGEVPDAVDGDASPIAVPSPSPPEPVLSLDAWRAEHDRALAQASLPVAVAATALTDEAIPDQGEDLGHGLQKRPRDLDLPPWLKGRYGTAVGRAVHGVLQTIDLGSGSGLDAVVAAQCEAEAITDRAGDVARLARDALTSPSVVEAAAAPHWREVYACAPIDGRLLEGYVDLLYRGPDGLVVVDHKTAATNDPGELDRRVEGYRLQGASYALTVATATGEPVVRVTFLFLTPTGPVERHLDDLDASVERVRELVRAGRELVVEEPAAV